MFEIVKIWFQSAQEPPVENKWNANTVTMQQPSSPLEMNKTVTEQPVCKSRPLITFELNGEVTGSYYRKLLSLWMFICVVEAQARVSAVECEYRYSAVVPVKTEALSLTFVYLNRCAGLCCFECCECCCGDCCGDDGPPGPPGPPGGGPPGW